MSDRLSDPVTLAVDAFRTATNALGRHEANAPLPEHTPQIKDLLDRWASVGDTVTQAPGLVHPRVRVHSPGEPDAYTVVHSGFWHGFRVDPDTAHGRAHILMALLESVIARGYDFDVSSDAGCLRYEVEMFRYLNFERLHIGSGETDVDGSPLLVALGNAYLDGVAGEAEACRQKLEKDGEA